MTKFLMSCALAGFITITAACGSDSTTSPTSTLPGTYTLKTVNGGSLPYTFSESGGTFKVNSGTLTITSSSFTNTFNITQTPTGGAATTATKVCTGTYTVSGSVASFKESSSTDCGDSYPGTYTAETTITIVYDGSATAVYQK